jgi:F-box and WD-40 domain protein CDC4
MEFESAKKKGKRKMSQGLAQTLGKEMRRALGLHEDHVAEDFGDEDEETLIDTQKSYDPGRPSFMSCSSIGWGQPNSIIVSGGCDKVLKVWDAKSG